jgi:uncharacterized circularly permuted ATP-grasp superfamily protein/uncharacterized alpha-E superfamily protein
MESAPGSRRPHWEKLVGALERLGRDELRTRWEEARRILAEHGVTYNVYSDAQGLDRPWELDMVPLLIPPQEWRHIEAALIQRTRLLNLVLADLYGPQRLLHEGLLPPALVFANPAFLRPCHGIRPLKDVYLFLHAVDLARAPDGQWWALADRAQAPSGAGYALENRIVLSRILPDEFRDCQVQRLASFFQIGRDTLRGLAPQHHDHPNVVLLTPGPYNETYFEQAYLARYLGFTLVEGGDLTVRDRRVFIKTLEGLQPVDVVLRRVDDTFCDPLELRADSVLGVPGLVEAARAGHVALANALGSGLVENPALLAFLPGLCRHLLGEELKMPSVATWWCGQSKELRYVVENLDRIVVKRAFAPAIGEPFFGERLGDKRRAALLAEMQAVPHEFVGQELVALSMAPVWTNKQIVPRPLVLRAFVVAAGDSYAVMPGGLTRVSTSPHDPVVSMQSGGGSKDTWVITEGPVSMVTLLRPPSQAAQLERAAAEVPSRVADNLFWLGRYAERLEGTLRLFRCVLRRLSGEAGAEQTPDRSALVRMLVRLELVSEEVRADASLEEVEREVLSLVYRAHRAGGVRELVNHIRHTAAVVRDRFSADTWRIFTQLQTDSRARPRRLPVADALALVNTLITDLAAFSGLEMENMTRGHGWRFLDIGRRLERAIQLALVVRAAAAADPKGSAALEPLLEIADSVMTYRRRYFAQPQWPTVLHLLLVDDTNPRSLQFQLNALKEHAANLPADRNAPGPSLEQRKLTAIWARLHGADPLALARAPVAGASEELERLLAAVGAELRVLSDALTQHYFSHTLTQVS